MIRYGIRYGIRFGSRRSWLALSLAGLVLGCDRDPRGPVREPAPAAAPAEGPGDAPTASGVTPSVAAPGSGAHTEDEQNSIAVFNAAAPATVFVTNKRVVLDNFSRPVEVAAGSGSGFIWDALGHVVTNHHVAKNAQAFSVTLHDHRTFDAKLVGGEPRKDIAVLRLIDPPGDLATIRVERALELSVGQKTLAIGNPFGLDQTLTTGVVSALGRSLPGRDGVAIRDTIQTDAAINPGNSGGPLLDSSGRLIGMNTAIYSPSGSSAGIGFAVPVSAIARIVPQIISKGKADQIGVGVVIDPERAFERRYGIRGVLVLSVTPGSPAERAGLRGTRRMRGGISFGDVIVGVDDDVIANYDDLYHALDRRRPGDEVKLWLLRGRERLSVKIELTLLP
jgi:S1-C subfamily serine protease